MADVNVNVTLGARRSVGVAAMLVARRPPAEVRQSRYGEASARLALQQLHLRQVVGKQLRAIEPHGTPATTPAPP